MRTTSHYPCRVQLIQARANQPQTDQAAAAARAGFTLVELLMVIVVIGILAGMLLVAIGGAVTKVNEAAITIEITGLQTAMLVYRQEAGGFPPTMCLCWTEWNDGDVASRQNRFLRHLRKRFPRLAGIPYEGNQGIRMFIENNYEVDIDQLDAAESLVFWLAGFPDVNNIEQTKTLGFSIDPANPFKFGGSRTQRLYEFDPRRLTDVDNDGWWEYVPDGTTSVGDQMPPYVYFDSASYGLGPQYPSSSPAGGSGDPGPPFTGSPGAAWGRASPYHVAIVGGNSTGVHEVSSFQLISAGLDAIYGDVGSGPTGFMSTEIQPLRRDTTNRVGWTEFEEDNLTNFHDSRLGSMPN